MSPTDAADRIGCSPQQVRYLIRKGEIRARKVRTSDNQYGYVYSISEQEVERYRSQPKTIGAPRTYRRQKKWKPPKV